LASDDKRELYKGLDDGYTHAIEMVATPIVAGGIGYLIDHQIGTMPGFTIALVVMAVVASFVKMYYVYDAEMKAHDAASPWGPQVRDREHPVGAEPPPSTSNEVATRS